MKIGIIGSGISSLSAGYYLKKMGHDITLFESGEYFGGHANTVDFQLDGKTLTVDTGFLVFNDLTYPRLIEFFREIGISSYSSDMSLSVFSPFENMYWNGSNLKSIFLQKKNIFSPKFLKMITDILKFNKNSKRYLELSSKDNNLSLKDLLSKERYSQAFIDWYLIPMSASIWSTPPGKILEFPAYTFFNFTINHRLLQVLDRPVWKTVSGGSRSYVNKVISYLEKVHLNEEVLELERSSSQVGLKTNKGSYFFDKVISGVHAPTNLKFIKDKTPQEQEILSAFQYEKNPTYLHRDASFLPPDKRAWASWNYLRGDKLSSSGVTVSYLLNKLQNIDTDKPIMVTLNPHKEIDPSLIIKKIDYEHPLFDTQTIKYQKEIEKIQGLKNLYFVGAWQRYGFHEDGIMSGLKVVDLIRNGK